MNWNYISGFFDADGSIQLNKIHPNQLPSPVITFHNNERVILEKINKFIYKQLEIKGTIVTKKKKGYSDQFELRYSYFSKFSVLADRFNIYHPKKLKRINFIRMYKSHSKRNGKYTSTERQAIESILRQWE